MSAIKERIIGALTIMNNNDAEKLWKIIQKEFNNNDLWDYIEEDTPTEEELNIIKVYEKGAEQYQPYISHESAKKELLHDPPSVNE